MKIIYDDETQVALDELDRNITARTKYLTVNTFGCKSMAVLLTDPILQQLQNIKTNLIATATSFKYEIDKQELSSADKLAINSMFGEHKPFTCKREDVVNDTYNDRMFEREITITKALSVGKTEELINSGINDMHKHFDKEFAKVVGNFNTSLINASAAAEVTTAQIREAMAKLSLKKAPVFDEMNKFHDEPMPVSLAVPRDTSYPVQVDLNEFRIYKEESE